MKTLLGGIVVLALLAGVGYAVYHFAFSTSSERACGRRAGLCSPEAVKKCEAAFAKFEEMSGAKATESMKRLDACLGQSTTCPAALGCLVRAGLGAAGEFLDGLKRVLKGD